RRGRELPGEAEFATGARLSTRVADLEGGSASGRRRELDLHLRRRPLGPDLSRPGDVGDLGDGAARGQRTGGARELDNRRARQHGDAVNAMVRQEGLRSGEGGTEAPPVGNG